MAEKQGSQTPTQSVTLAYDKTLGQEAIDLYAKTGNDLLEWHQLLEYDIMAVNDEGLWTHQKYGYFVLSGSGFDSGWAEWSVDNQRDPHDIDAWYQANPSLGTILTERKIRAEITTDDVDFNIQRLGLWLRYNQKSAISKTEWQALKIKEVPKLSGKLFVGIKFGQNGDKVAMSVAVRTSKKDIFVEAIDCRPIRDGSGWILEYLMEMDTDAVVIDGANGQQLLAKEMKETCYLTDEEKVIACEMAAKAGANFVKTSTGFGTGGANPHDVALMKKSIPDTMKVKASGGMHNWDDAKANIEVGADRLGVSASLAILDSYTGE